MSATTLIVFLPEDDTAPIAWSHWADGERLSDGEDVTAAPPPNEDMRVVAIAPADAVTLHWVALPDLAPAQARAAALLLAAEASAGPVSTLHVALGPVDGDGRRAMALTDRGRMAGWLARLGALGLDPHAVYPAPLLLPTPSKGFSRGPVGGTAVVRGVDFGVRAG